LRSPSCSARWVKVADTLPPAPAAAEDPAEALFAAARGCIDKLLFDLLRGAGPTTDHSESTWDLLLSKLAVPANAARDTEDLRSFVVENLNADADVAGTQTSLICEHLRGAAPL
jgi:hypothetical protein